MPRDPKPRRTPGWSDLQPYLLEEICERLSGIADGARLRAVCRSWRAVSPRLLPRPLPWLAAPHLSDASPSPFFTLSDDIIYNLSLPVPAGTQCFGSSHGWLFLLGLTPQVHLFNPFTGARIQLPPLTTLPFVLDFRAAETDEEYVLRAEDGSTYTESAGEVRDLTIDKAILSSDPSTTAGCIAFVILLAPVSLAFCRVGGSSWTVIEDIEEPVRTICDAVCYKGRFYVIGASGSLGVCDLGRSPKVTVIKSVRVSCGVGKFLVEESEELLIVARHMRKPSKLYFDGQTDGFCVHKVDLCGKPSQVKMGDIRGSVLFLGQNQSLSLRASDIPGCKENSIYYTDACCKDGYRSDVVCRFDLSAFSVEHVPHCLEGRRSGVEASCVTTFSLEDGNIGQLSCVLLRSSISAEDSKLFRTKWVFPEPA